MNLRKISIAALALTVSGAGVITAAATASTHTPTVQTVRSSASLPASPDQTDATEVQRFDAFDANQGIAVDRDFFYAVDNRTITKHSRKSGEALLQFAGDTDGPIEHLDSGVVVKGKLFAAHSNYSEWPMESSIEVFDTRTMKHVDSHSFGIFRGSLTWLDYHDGAWWAAFANYDRVVNGEPYGKTYNTQVVKMDDDFTVTQSWTIPKAILDKFEVMSNSGGSWGPDGKLYLTGHDLPEAYVMELPAAGGELEWVATVSLPGIHGQGIAWDRSSNKHRPSGKRHSKKPRPSQPATLWGISRPSKEAIAYTIPTDSLGDGDKRPWTVLGPSEFRR